LFYAKCLPFYLARTIPKIIKLLRYLRKSKVVMQGKLIAVAYTLRTYWNQFSLGGICKQDVSVFVQYPRRLKALSFDNFDNSHNSFLLREYFIDYLCERWIPCQASTSVLCLHYRPVTVHCSTKDAYTSEITFLALNPWGNLCCFLYVQQ